MNAEFFEALAMLEKERGMPADYLLEKIKTAIVIAVKKDYEVEDENVSVVIEPDQGKFSVSLLKTVVEEVEDPATEITLEEAQQKKKSARWAMNTPSLSRQRSSAASPRRRPSTSSAKASRRPSAARCTPRCRARPTRSSPPSCTKVEPVKGIVTLELGKRRGHRCPATSRCAGEDAARGPAGQGLCCGCDGDRARPAMMISRTHPGLVKRHVRDGGA